MKTPHNTNKAIGLGSLLALALAIIVRSASAGPSIQFWKDLGQVKTQTQAKETESDSKTTLVCGACQTVKLTEVKSGLPDDTGAAPRTAVHGG